MNFTNLSGLGVGLGLLGIAAVLFFLQRLRVRHRPHEVVTTLFWKQAVEEARARVLVRRFRHLPAYLLALLIAGLAWLGFADPESSGTGERDYVVLLDGSSRMAGGTRFAEAVTAVEALTAGLPRNHRQVVLCSSVPGTMLQPGEHLQLLRTRLGTSSAAPCPPTVDAVCASWAFSRPTTLIVCGAAQPSQATLDALPQDVEVQRLALDSKPSSTPSGIRALGFGRGSSSAWETVDVLCTIDSDAAPEVQFQIDGQPLSAQPVVTRSGRRTRLELRDLPATGGLLRADLADAPTGAANGTAWLQLPDRQPIRVALAPSAAPVFEPVLRADPAITLVTDRPDVRIRGVGDPAAGGDVPEFILVAPASQTESFLIQHPAAEDSHAVLREALTKLRLTEIDATSMAETGDTVISLGAAPAARRGIRVWASLLGSDFHFVGSRAFPVFVAQSIRWLAGWEPQSRFALAGREVTGTTGRHRVVDASAPADAMWLDPVGAAFIPPAAGVFASADGRQLGALTPLPDAASPPSTIVDATPPTLGTSDLSLWIAGLLAALLLIEWFLVRSGRMP